MRHLMRDDGKDTAPRAVRSCRGIEQQAALEEGDAAPVLHRAAEAAGHRDQVELGQRIFDAEIVVEPSEQFRRTVERELPLRSLAGGGDDTDRHAFHLRRDALQFAHRQHEQIGRHFWRGRESDPLQVRLQRLLFRDRHVADGKQMARDHDRQLETRLERRLVPARKYPPRVRRLELARQQPLHAAVGRIIDEEEAAVELVDRRRKLDAQPMRAHRERLFESEGCRLGRSIGRDVGALKAIVGGNGSKRRVDGVERQPRRRFAHFDIDQFDAGKREALGVRSQLD